MAVEFELKNLILSRFKSLRDFAIQIDMPVSTLDSIFKRGIEKAGVSNIIKICDALLISVDELSEGRIVPKSEHANNLSVSEYEDLLRAVKRLGGINSDGSRNDAQMERILTFLRSGAQLIDGNSRE